jgi:hypothetical protein
VFYYSSFVFNCSFNSEDMMMAALEDLRAGRTLVETAATYHIPRSTLYVRARAHGIALSITRQEHSSERVQAAVQAVAGKLTGFECCAIVTFLHIPGKVSYVARFLLAFVVPTEQIQLFKS